VGSRGETTQQRRVEDRLWELIDPWSRPGRRRAVRVGGPGSMTVPRWTGSCSCSTPAAAGETYW